MHFPRLQIRSQVDKSAVDLLDAIHAKKILAPIDFVSDITADVGVEHLHFNQHKDVAVFKRRRIIFQPPYSKGGIPFA